jgi:hypothetical protein
MILFTSALLVVLFVLRGIGLRGAGNKCLMIGGFYLLG